MPDKILIQPEITVAVDSDKVGEKSDDESRKKRGTLLNNFSSSEKINDLGARYTVLDIFRNRHLTINVFCLAFMWSVKLFTYCIMHNTCVREAQNTGLNGNKYGRYYGRWKDGDASMVAPSGE